MRKCLQKLLNKTNITHVPYGGQLYSYYIFITSEANHDIRCHLMFVGPCIIVIIE